MASWAQVLGAYPFTVLLGTRTKKKAIGETRASDGFARCKREGGGRGGGGENLPHASKPLCLWVRLLLPHWTDFVSDSRRGLGLASFSLVYAPAS